MAIAMAIAAIAMAIAMPVATAMAVAMANTRPEHAEGTHGHENRLLLKMFVGDLFLSILELSDVNNGSGSKFHTRKFYREVPYMSIYAYMIIFDHVWSYMVISDHISQYRDHIWPYMDHRALRQGGDMTNLLA